MPLAPLFFQFLATATAEDVFRGVNQTTDASPDPRTLFALAVAGVALVLLLLVLSRRKAEPTPAKATNSPAKLTRELLKKSRLRRSDIKHLKYLAEQQQLNNPLVLVLCPSVLKRATQARRRAAAAAIERGE